MPHVAELAGVLVWWKPMLAATTGGSMKACDRVWPSGAVQLIQTEHGPVTTNCSSTDMGMQDHLSVVCQWDSPE